jgi:hypothetical protein
MKINFKKSLALVALVATLGLSVPSAAHADWGHGGYGWHGGWGYHPYWRAGYGYGYWVGGYWHPYAYPGYYGSVVYSPQPVYVAPAPVFPIGVSVGFHIR